METQPAREAPANALVLPSRSHLLASPPGQGVAVPSGGRASANRGRERRSRRHHSPACVGAGRSRRRGTPRGLDCAVGNAGPGERLRPKFQTATANPCRMIYLLAGPDGAAVQRGRGGVAHYLEAAGTAIRRAACASERSPLTLQCSRIRPRCGAAHLGRRELREVEREAAPPASEGVLPRISSGKDRSPSEGSPNRRPGASLKLRHY